MEYNDLNRWEAALALEQAIALNNVGEINNYLRRLAELGVAQKYSDIAKLYENGNEKVKVRLDLAFEWYKKAAFEQIDDEGYFGLGKFYLYGMHVDKDPINAAKMFREAAALGSPEGRIMLGICLMNGIGLSTDLNQAKECLMLAANENYPIAYFLLSRIELKHRHYFRAFRLWWKCANETRLLTLKEPNSPRLFYLHGAWKL